MGWFVIEPEVDEKNRRDVWGRRLDKATFGLAVAFFLFVFISKAAMNSLGALLLLVGFVSMGVNREKIFKKNPILVLFLIPIVVGAVAALFSESGGLPAVAGLLNRLKFFFLPLVLAPLVTGEKRLWWLFGAVLFSGVVASLTGLFHPVQRLYGHFSGMHEIGRNADMLMITLLGLISLLGNSVFRKRVGTLWLGIMGCVAVLFFWGMVMSGIRGAWVGLLAGVAMYALLFNRKFLIVGGILVVLAFSMGPGGTVIKEFKSIGNTTSNASNLARLQLWRTGLDFSKNHLFFGSGRDGVKERFKEFFHAQPEEYQKKYPWSIRYPGHFHNSYIQLFVEGGLLFFVVFAVCGGLVMYGLFRALAAGSALTVYSQTAIVASSGFLVTQFFHSELYSYGGALMILVLFAGLAAPKWQETKAPVESNFSHS